MMDMQESSTAMMMAATPSVSAAASSPMAMDMGGSCKISMLWNWNIIDACFISPTWRIKSHGMFAGSCVGVILLVMSLEFLRRVQRSYERSNLRSNKYRKITTPGASNNSLHDVQRSKDMPAVQDVERAKPKLPLRRALVQQTIRASLHTLCFAVAYFVMLLAMYYNGYFIICILIGAFLGSFAFSWDQLRSRDGDDATEVTGCCG